MLTALVLRTTQGEHEEQDAAAVGPDRNVLLQQLAQTATLCCMHFVMAQATVALTNP